MGLDEADNGLGEFVRRLRGHGDTRAPQAHRCTRHFVETSLPAGSRGAAEVLERILTRQLGLHRGVGVPDPLGLDADGLGALGLEGVRRGEQQEGDSQDNQSEQNSQNESEQQENSEQQDQQSQEGNQDQQEQQQQNQPPEEQEGSESNSEQNTPSESTNEEFEEQQSLEQWLRRIEDDPGELLRRKFRYQYRQRQLNGTANNTSSGGQIW